MNSVRDVLTGAELVDLGRHTRDAYHWLSDQARVDEGTAARIHQDFVGLVLDADPDVRAAAVCWFGQHHVPGVGPILVAAFLSSRADYEGQPQSWLPGGQDQLDWLRIAVAKNALGVPGALDITKDSVLRPGRGQDVFVALLHQEPTWVQGHLPRIAVRSPEVVDILFFHLGILGIDTAGATAQLATEAPDIGDVLLRVLVARDLDLEQAVLRLAEQLDSAQLRAWIEAEVPPGPKQAAALALLP